MNHVGDQKPSDGHGSTDPALNPHDGDDEGRPKQLGIGRSIRPGTAVPPTVLISDMGSGAVYLEGWRAGPSVYLSAEDAVGLRQELASAFGAEDLPPRADPGWAL
jgi:hypothetical protein